MRLAVCIVSAACCLFAVPSSGQAVFSETFLEAPGPNGPLKGTLTSPRSMKPLAVVLIVPGSGPIDRDGNSPVGVEASTYRLLSQGLAAQGLASLRIDKRGMFASAAAVPDANAVTVADYVGDVGAWMKVLRNETGVACVWMLGHSEGGLVALASAKGLQGVCGLILIAVPGRPLGEVLRSQLRANPANEPIWGQAMPAIDALEQGRRVDTKIMQPALQALFNPGIQGFLISAFSYDPLSLIAGVDEPVLVVQGERDLQVGVEDARLLKQADPKAKLVLLPDVNHVLKAVTGDDPRANLATYADPGLPLAPGVVDAIAEFSISNGTRSGR